MPSLYNKYRPLDFKDVIGQEAVCKTLDQQINSNSLHHSVILYGNSGSGKTTCARIIANSISSEKDIIEKDSALDGKVDNIRALQNEFIHTPWESDYKVYIFDEAHRISKAGFDSLLKTIEEPPSHVKFIFVTTSFSSLPITVRSRSQCFPFKYVSNNLLFELIKKVSKSEGAELSEETINLLAAAASGSPRQALVLLESVICKLNSGSNLEEIFETFGSIGPTTLTNFLTYHIFGDFNNLYKSSTIFTEQHIDLEQALSDLQQFIVDTRIGLIYPNNVNKLQTDVTKLIEIINQQEKTSGMNQSEYKSFINSRLDSIRELSLSLSKDLAFVRNKSALITGFVVDLALSWKT